MRIRMGVEARGRLHSTPPPPPVCITMDKGWRQVEARLTSGWQYLRLQVLGKERWDANNGNNINSIANINSSGWADRQFDEHRLQFAFPDSYFYAFPLGGESMGLVQSSLEPDEYLPPFPLWMLDVYLLPFQWNIQPSQQSLNRIDYLPILLQVWPKTRKLDGYRHLYRCLHLSAFTVNYKNTSSPRSKHVDDLAIILDG